MGSAQPSMLCQAPRSTEAGRASPQWAEAWEEQRQAAGARVLLEADRKQAPQTLPTYQLSGLQMVPSASMRWKV